MSVKKMMFWMLVGTFAVIISAVLFYSCGGAGKGEGTTTSTVGLYLTDDISLFTQVTGTIDQIQLISTGTGTPCDVLTVPTTVNIANLANLMQLINVTQCPAGPYNRIHIAFDKSVQLMSAPTGTPSSCSFVSYKDEGNHKQPNILQCDPVSNICTLDINGAVNVFAHQQNKLALDFNLKDFDVMNADDPSTCTVTMKVSPLHGGEIEALGHPEAITGLVSNLTTTDEKFDLTRGNMTFSVLYTGITTTDQPGIDTLLQRAQDDQLRTKVVSSTIDFMNNEITASAILVKVEGTVSNLITNATFSVNYGPGGTGSIDVDYSKATVVGTVTNGSWVDVRLYGYSSMSNNFLAKMVEVENSGTMTED
jgi:hypothetical protein